jgi:hypothetical protein
VTALQYVTQLAAHPSLVYLYFVKLLHEFAHAAMTFFRRCLDHKKLVDGVSTSNVFE